MSNEKKQGCGCGCGGHGHEHEENHECGCGGHEHEVHEYEENEEAQVIYLTLDDEEEIACKVLTIFEVKGNEYISLLPENSEDVYIYKYKETEEGPELAQIENDDEFKNVSQEFYNLCD
ncbi:DUF1292 domain-containing protein [Tepidibacter sp. Z1-5]|uniref:DUF1292 domain-containing protein n=1 Tax=Tepidibacter sp. Z1-5 TaxID=3134138 RepID=UPI0030BE9B31